MIQSDNGLIELAVSVKQYFRIKSNMGNKNLTENSSFPDYLQIINDHHSNQGHFDFRDTRDGSLCIGRKINSNDQHHQHELQNIITQKIQNPSPFLIQLLAQNKDKQDKYCSNQTVFYLLFRKPSWTLTQQFSNRKRAGRSFSIREVDEMVTRVTKAVKYLYDVNHYHGHISSDAVSWPQSNSQSIKLIDEWAMHTENISPIKQCSSKKENDNFNDKLQSQSNDLRHVGQLAMEMLGGNYDPKNIRLNAYSGVSAIQHENLKQKLLIMNDKDDQKRLEIYKLLENNQHSWANNKFNMPNSANQQAHQNGKLQSNYSEHLSFVPQSYKQSKNNVQPVIRKSSEEQLRVYHTNIPARLNYPNNSINSFTKNQKKNFVNSSQINIPPIPKETIKQPLYSTGHSHYAPPKINFSGSKPESDRHPPMTPYDSREYFYRNMSSNATAKFNHGMSSERKGNSVSNFNSENSQSGHYSLGTNTHVNSFQTPKFPGGFVPPMTESIVPKQTESFMVGENFPGQIEKKSSLFSQLDLGKNNIQNLFQNLNLLNNSHANSNPLSHEEKPYLMDKEEEKNHMSTEIGEVNNPMSPVGKYDLDKHQNHFITKQNKSPLFNQTTQAPNDLNTLSINNINKIAQQKENKDAHIGSELSPNHQVTTIPELSESANSVADDDKEYVIEEYQNGSKYEGYKYNGMRNGWGRFHYQEGSYYEGDWKNNNMHGQGKLYYSTNKLAYEGQWYMDQFHGKGKVYNDDPTPLEGPFDYTDFQNLDQQWVHYEGTLVSDSKEGFGVLTLSNGERYEGQFQNDYIHGKGKYHTLSGQIINGIWKNSELEKCI